MVRYLNYFGYGGVSFCYEDGMGELGAAVDRTVFGHGELGGIVIHLS